MRSVLSKTLTGLCALGLAACAPSPAEVTQQLTAAINAKNVDGAVALVAPAATATVKPAIEALVAKNAKLETVGQLKIEGETVTAVEKLTNDEYTKLGVAPVEATLVTKVVKGKVVEASVAITPEAQAKVDGALAQLTKKVVEDYDAAIAAKNLDGALALVADNAVLACLDGKTYTGKAEIKKHYEDAAAQNAVFEPGERTVSGNKVTYKTKVTLDDWKKLNVAPLEADAVALVADGKVSSLTLTLTADADAKLKEAVASAAPAKKGGKGGKKK